MAWLVASVWARGFLVTGAERHKLHVLEVENFINVGYFEFVRF